MSQSDHEVIILGGGPAGLTAGLYAARSGLEVVIIENSFPGGQIVNTAQLDNYPGFSGGGGPELARKMEEQAKKFGTEIMIREPVEVDLCSQPKRVVFSEGELTADVIIIATGSEPRQLKVPGEEKFTGRGVSYCATCDAAFYRDVRVVVVGGGDSALKEALHLTNFASEVIIIHRRDELRAVKAWEDKARREEKIRFVLSSVVEEIFGEDEVQGVIIRNKETGKKKKISAHGVFIYVGHKPNTALFTGQLELSETGHIMTDELMATTRGGVYAAGDVREKHLRQVITAASDGAVAATQAAEYLQEVT